jgi:hypothetical protein
MLDTWTESLTLLAHYNTGASINRKYKGSSDGVVNVLIVAGIMRKRVGQQYSHILTLLIRV